MTELAERISVARALWLEIETLAVDHLDDELDSRIAIARLAILDVRDRVEQLRVLAELAQELDGDEARA